jgi:hypothetical protein
MTKVLIKTVWLLVVLCLPVFSMAQGWSPKKAPLMTKWASDVNLGNTLPEYPRPQMVRSEWLNLNGLWEFEVGEQGDRVPFGTPLSKQILVPFPVESALSGVMEQHERVWYRRKFSIPKGWEGQQLVLHFGAVDWESEIYVNGKSVGIHRGGYDPFSYDITQYLKGSGEQELIVRVFDPTQKMGQPRGKQEISPHEILIMYTPITGIWQTVWLEPVPVSNIKGLKMVPDIDNSFLKLTVEVPGLDKDVVVKATVSDGKSIVSKSEGKSNIEFQIPIPYVKLWSPNDPFLYDIKVELKKGKFTLDEVSSYFGMRKISLGEVDGYQKILLNNEFVFNFGFLDQGYWPDGLYTAPTDEALKADIEIQKALGYNMVRKHIKVEPQRWYYWADKLGILVWQDMPSSNSYISNDPPIEKAAFEQELVNMVNTHMNSPSIVSWVIFNEMQGQYDTKRLTRLVAELDPSRLINPASDNIDKDYVGHIFDKHSYPGPISPSAPNMALVCGEFGSIGLNVKNHEWMENKGVSGVMVNSVQELTKIYEGFVNQLLDFKSNQGMSGAVFTQLADVEQEVNGFLTYDRILKIDTVKVKQLNEKLIYQTIISTSEILPNSKKKKQTWHYTFHKPKQDWTSPSFNHESWKDGSAGFGFGQPKEAPSRTVWNTDDIWMRKKFVLGNLSENDKDNLFFTVFNDEDYEIYINGVLVALAKGFTKDYEFIPINEDGKKALIPNGENCIAVHCHQTGGGQFIDVGIIKMVYSGDSRK